MTSTTSHTNRHKFRVQWQNTYIYIAFQSDLVNQSYQFPIRQIGTHRIKVETHSPPPQESRTEKTSKESRKQRKIQQIMTNTISHNSCRESQIKSQNKTISYISELEKRDN